MTEDLHAFLRTKPRRATTCKYIQVRDSMPAEVRAALIDAEDDAQVDSTRMLALINRHAPRSIGITALRRHRNGCPTCNMETT